jgi:hypothetical protein
VLDVEQDERGGGHRPDPPRTQNKSNIKSTVIADNFVALPDVCQGLSHGAGGVCP